MADGVLRLLRTLAYASYRGYPSTPEYVHPTMADSQGRSQGHVGGASSSASNPVEPS
jgi:hypothetical protein